MKCQILFSGKNKKNISKCLLLKILPRVLSVKMIGYTWRFTRHFFRRETTFVISYLLSAHQSPSEKGSTFFTFRVDPFSEGIRCAGVNRKSQKLPAL